MTPDCLKEMQGYAKREYNHFSQLDLYGFQRWAENQLLPYLNRKYTEVEAFNIMEMLDVDIDFNQLLPITSKTDEDAIFEDCMTELNRMVALECLLTALASNDSDMIVIMAGYEKPMKRMLETNPGMRGRFPYLFNFEDYTADELTQICVNKLVSKEFIVTDDVKDMLLQYIRKALQEKDADFHNARWAEQFAMVGIVSAMAARMFKGNNRHTQQVDLCNILPEDVVNGYELTNQWRNKDKDKQIVQRIGFR